MITAASYGRVWQALHFVSEGPLQILLAEDDEQLAALVETTLEGDPRFTVVGHARTGDEAVTLCAEHSPDIVLMDIGMPGRDGIEATHAIHGRDPEQHVVIYTGSDEYGDVARADEAGAAGFLHKDALTSPELADALHVLHTNYVRALPDID
jgi:NarL family two-component system response regulator LiaR